eukprot:12126-Heterococcus_DN1.PRE.2
MQQAADSEAEEHANNGHDAMTAAANRRKSSTGIAPLSERQQMKLLALEQKAAEEALAAEADGDAGADEQEASGAAAAFKKAA